MILRVAFGIAALPLLACGAVLLAMPWSRYDGDLGTCAARRPGALEQLVKNYLSVNSKPTVGVVFTPPFRYDDATNWWIVPFKAKSTRYDAIVDCKGGIELTGALD